MFGTENIAWEIESPAPDATAEAAEAAVVDYVETKKEIADLPPIDADYEEEEFSDDDFDFSEYFEDADMWDESDDDDYYEEEDYAEDDEEAQIERERYAHHLQTFMDDFEPSDQLTTEIEPHATQSYQIRIESQPTIIKTAMAMTNGDPEPIIVKVFKKGSDMPVKDLRGKTEVLDVVEIIEDHDIGTYIVEFTNTSRYV